MTALKNQIENQINEEVIITNADNDSVDFKTTDGSIYWAKLTKTGKVKTNSIRLNRW